jgi:lipopolysaccharide/colanic/teichoic acid biosynthesis glycosyltransferase
MRAAAKRTFDVLVALAGLLVLAPVLGLIAVVVKLESRGPVLFRQERVGRYRKPFTLVKFRTMVADAERLGPNVSSTGDDRFTRVGVFLRRSFLDEAPQLLNVLKGDMSLVGPRPETPEYVELLTAEERGLLSVRPGMAGPSTLAYSAHEAAILAQQDDPDRYYRDQLLHDRASADLRYLDDPTLAGDIAILARTGLLVLCGLGVVPARWSRRSVTAGR